MVGGGWKCYTYSWRDYPFSKLECMVWKHTWHTGRDRARESEALFNHRIQGMEVVAPQLEKVLHQYLAGQLKVPLAGV